MKKFDPKEGGHKFRLDDLILMQDAYSDAVKGLVTAFYPTGNCILSGAGLSLNSGNHNITEGYIAFNGEVFQIAAKAITYDISKRVFLKIVQAVLPPSPVPYQDTTNQNVHYNRYMDMKYYDAGDGDDNNVNGVYYDEICPGGTINKGIVVEWEPDYNGEENDVFDDTGLGIGRMRGYAICNGLNGTRDLRGQFGLMPSVGMFNSAALISNVIDGVAVGAQGGSKTRSILQVNLPAYNLSVTDPGHTHWLFADVDSAPSTVNNTSNKYTVRAAGLGSNASYDLRGQNSLLPTVGQSSSQATGITVGLNGGGQALNVTPPYYSMIKIKRII